MKTIIRIKYNFDSDIDEVQVLKGENPWNVLCHFVSDNLEMEMITDADYSLISVKYDKQEKTATLIYPNGDESYFSICEIQD